MARRRFTNIILAFGLLCSLVASTAAEAQQVTFAISPTQVNPVVGDTLKLNISVQNFTNIVSLQYAIEWDGALLSYVAIDSVNMPDQPNFQPNPFGGNTALIGWNASGTAKSAPNGQRIFRLRLKVLAASSNYWAKFSDTNIGVIEVIQDPGLRSVTPIFVNLGTPPGTTTIPVGSKATGGSTLTGQKFCVPVTTTDFTSIVSAQWVNKWNPAVLRFDSVSTLNNTLGLRAANFGTTQTSGGRLAFSWNAPSGTVSVNNNDTLYKVCYTAIGANGTSSIVTFDSAEVYRRGGGSDNRVALNGVNGTVTVGTVVLPPTTGLVFAASNHVLANVGDTACVRIRVGSFNDIAIMQWSMHWDSTKMTLVGVNSTAGVGIAPWTSITSQGDFNNLINGNPSGTLRFLWASPSGNGYTLADSTILMELCFKYIGAGGTNSTLRFDGIPLKSQVKDANLVNVPAIFRVGNVSIVNSVAVTTFTGVTQNTNCAGSSDGSITLTASGGTGAYTYSWTGPNGFTSSVNPITGRIAGKYYVTVTGGTTSKIDSFTINQPAAVTISTQLTQVSCNGGTTGAIVTTPSGGTGAYTYSWLMPNSTTLTSKDLANLAAGIYKLTVTDAKSCTGVRIDTITAPTVLAASTQLTQINCNGGTNGTVVTTPSGGTGPYTYSWLMPNGTTLTSKDLANLAAGIYKLTVTDAKLCTTTRADTIKAPAALAISTVVTNVICKNGNNGSIVTTPSGGTAPYTYAWSNGATSKDLATLVAGTYTLTLTDAQLCATTRAETITEPDSVRIGTATITGTRCSQATGVISIAAVTGGTSGYTFAWAGPNNTTFATQNIVNVAPGSYTLTVKDAKLCQAVKTFEVVDTAANVTNSTPSVTNVLCNGGSTGAITLTATGSGPLTYSWTGPNGYTATTLPISGLKIGNYTLVITDAGCRKTISATVTEPTVIVTGVQSVNIKCKGELMGSIAINATGGTGALTITWTGPNGYTATGQNIGTLPVGTYVATIKDANLCEKTESITITEPSTALAISNANVTNAACNGGTGTIALTITGGTSQYSYTWTGVGGFTSTQKDIAGLRGGEYRVTVSDGNGCNVPRIFNVIDPPAIVVNAGTTDASGSPNGTITLNVTGGQQPYTFLWTGQGVAPTAQNQTGLCSGTYNVTVKDNAQCSVPKLVTVGGSCSTPIRITSTALPTNAGCSGQNLGKIDVTWEGGVAPFRADWLKLPTNDIISTTDNVLSRSATLTSQPAGSYRIKITDAIGQSFLSNVYVINGTTTPLSISIAVTNETCSGSDGSIALTVGNGANPYTYRWTVPQPNVTEQPPTRTALSAGTYGVTVTDANGCAKDTGGIVVRRTPCAIITNSTKSDPRCFSSTDGSITINITNGEPAYTIRWVANGNQQTVINNAGSRGGTYTITGLGSGLYNVTVTDAANQTQTITHTLVAPSQIVVNKTITGDQGTCTGSIVLGVSGGSGNYIYQWNTGATSRDLFNLCCNDGRTYSVIVKDANANICQVSTSNDVIPCNIAALRLDSTVIRNPICQSDSTNSRIDAFVRGGVMPYLYEWRNQVGTVVGTNSPILLNQPPGRYYLTVLDSRTPNPQRVVFDGLLKVSSTLDIASISVVNPPDDLTLGSATISISGGVAPYTVRWIDGTTTTTSTNTATNAAVRSGRGEIWVTDLQGCVVKRNLTIVSNACATIRINTIFATPTGTLNIRCAKVCDGGATILSLSPDFVLPIRSYQWTSGEVGSTAFKLCGGINQVTITDANGKVCTTRIELKAPPLLKVDTIWVDDKARTLEAVPKGGTPPYSYRWTTDNIDTSRKVTINRSGKYVVLLTDALGCDDISKSVEIIFDANCLEGAVILSPNDDGRNENFRIKACSYKGIRLEVYNRWGQLVYFSTDYRDQWYGNKTDGASGDPLPDGVYMYVLSATDATGKQQLGKGTVNIVRN